MKLRVLLLCFFALIAAAMVPGGSSARAASKADKAAGAVLFHEKGCEFCHAPNAVADDKGPDLSSIGREWKRPSIERQIIVGGGGMPSFREELNPAELSQLLDFLQTKRAKPANKQR